MKKGKRNSKSVPMAKNNQDFWSGITRNNDWIEMEEFLQETNELTTNEALIRDIDLWEMKKSQKAVQSVTNASLMNCNNKLQKLRSLKMEDLRFSASNLPNVDTKMLDTIFHRSPGPAKPMKPDFRKKEFKIGFEDEAASKRFMKSFDFMASECNQEIAKDLVIQAQKKRKELNETKQLFGFAKNFKSMSQLQMESKIIDIIKELNSQRTLEASSYPQNTFDFTKEFKMFRNMSYNSAKMVQTLKKIIKELQHSLETKKNRLKDLRAKYTQLCAHLFGMNEYVDKVNNLEVLPSQPSPSFKKNKVKILLDHSGVLKREKEEKENGIIQETFQRIVAIQQKKELINQTMDSLSQDLSQLKTAKNDALKILRELYFYILENEEEFAEKSIRPIFKGFLSFRQEIPAERIPNFLDPKSLEFIWTICNLEMKADNLLKNIGKADLSPKISSLPGSLTNSPRNAYVPSSTPSIPRHKKASSSLISPQASTSLIAQSFCSNQKSCLSAKTTHIAPWKAKELSVLSSLKISCKKSEASIVPCLQELDKISQFNPFSPPKQTNKVIFPSEKGIFTKDKSNQKNKNELLLEIFKEINALVQKEKERLFWIFKKDQGPVSKILVAEFGQKEAEKTLKEFRANRLEEIKRREVLGMQSESREIKEKMFYIAPPLKRVSLFQKRHFNGKSRGGMQAERANKHSEF